MVKTRIRITREEAKAEADQPVTDQSLRLLAYLDEWYGPTCHRYMGLGGCGDALLTMGAAYGDPLAKVAFFANGNSRPLVEKFFEALGITAYVHHNIMGPKWGGYVISQVMSHPNFRPSAHLTDNYGEWVTDIAKFLPRITARLPFIELFGRKPDWFTSRVVCLCPVGGYRPDRKRYLDEDEYHKLVARLIGLGNTVVTVAEERELHVFGQHRHPRSCWLTDEFLLCEQDRREIDFKTMLAVVNTAEQMISVDTLWKTYSAMAGIPTQVIETRNHDGSYSPVGTYHTDNVFLNTTIWPHMSLVKIEDLLRWL